MKYQCFIQPSRAEENTPTIQRSKLDLMSQNMLILKVEVETKQDIEAYRKYEQIVQLNPDDADAYMQLGITYNASGYYQDAIDAYKQAIRLNPEDSRIKDSIEAYKRAIRLNPDNLDLYLVLGTIFDALGRYRDAMKIFSQAISRNPNFAGARYFFGLTLLSIGCQTAAFKEYKMLQSIDEDLASKLFDRINLQKTTS